MGKTDFLRREDVERHAKDSGTYPLEKAVSIGSGFSEPRVIIPTGLGINSHEELAECFRIAGAQPVLVHWNELIEKPQMLDQCQGAGLAGGFTKGDELGAGQSLANNIRDSGLREKLREKLDDPKFPVYCVCNCLQLLAKLDLMPFPVGTIKNDSGKHETSFWDTSINPACDTVWLQYLKDYTAPVFAPISHGEGRIYLPAGSLAEAESRNLIALRYAKGHMCSFYMSSRGDRYNPNGSTGDVAGFGWANNIVLFPHFERLHHNFQRPDRNCGIEGKIDGLYEPTYLMFRAAVNMMKTQ